MKQYQQEIEGNFCQNTKAWRIGFFLGSPITWQLFKPGSPVTWVRSQVTGLLSKRGYPFCFVVFVNGPEVEPFFSIVLLLLKMTEIEVQSFLLCFV